MKGPRLSSPLVIALGSATLLAAAYLEIPHRAIRGAAAPITTHDHPAHFFHADGIRLQRPARTQLLNRDGSLRVQSESDYRRFWRDIAPLLEAWARDPRLGINAAYVAALIAKESGFEPFATSWSPANGYTQLTHVADADMLQILNEAPEWDWMLQELQSFPRHALVHRPDASKPVTDSLVASGKVTSKNEYFFDPRQSTRAGVFWLRLLAEIWSEDTWPGRYGSFARERLNDGAPLTEDQLFDLVTVSYNQGYTYVYTLVERHGADWVRFADEEPADHLERIRVYTRLFEAG